MPTPNILVIPGSTRAGSWNVRLAGAITKSLAEKGAVAQRISLSDYDMPIYNGDLEEQEGPPANARKLGKLMSTCQGIVLVGPEYNGSITPLMKNTLDWLSRDLGDVKPYQNRVFGLAACSPGALGGIRSLSHVRDVLVSIGADLITPQLAVGQASSAFNEREELSNDRHIAILDRFSDTLIGRATDYTRGS